MLSRFGLHQKNSDDISEILHIKEFFGTHEKNMEHIVTEEKILEGLGTFGQKNFMGMIANLFGENRGRLRDDSIYAEKYWGLPENYSGGMSGGFR